VGVTREDQALAASALVKGLPADAPIGFAVHDEQLRFELVSHSLAAINGRPVAEHFGRRVTDILPPALAAAVEGLLTEVRDTGTARTGIEIDGATDAQPGERRTWVAGFYPMQIPGRRLVGVVLVDVTDRRRAQEALKESEAVLSGAQRMAGVGWWTWTVGPDAAVYAPELLDLLGRDPAHGGRPHSVLKLQLADEGELDAIRKDAMESLATGRPFARRMWVLHADGHVRVLDARGDVVYDDAGEAVGLQGFSQDITELVRAEQRQRAVAELGQQALEHLDIDALLQSAVDALGREIGVDGVGALEILPGGDRARIRAVAGRDGTEAPQTMPIEPGGVIDRVLTTREPIVVGDLLAAGDLVMSALEREGGARSVVTVLIDGPTVPFGVLGAMSERPHHFSEDDTAFLTAIANVLADAVERHAAEREIADISAARGRLVAQAIDAEDRARRRISEALHDGALQELLAVRNELYALEGRGGDDDALASAQERLTAILARLREVMSAMHPTMLHYGGLEAALLAVAEQEFAGQAFEAHVEVDDEAAGAHDELVLSLARELLANAARHAAASRVEVEVRREPGEILLSVTDDGSGLMPGRVEAALAAGGIGVASCRERVEALGGSLTVRSAPGAGTRAVALIPYIPESSSGRAVETSHLDEGSDGA
jgi:signal transduction histidine kinase/PAS domain-containing protein